MLDLDLTSAFDGQCEYLKKHWSRFRALRIFTPSIFEDYNGYATCEEKKEELEFFVRDLDN